MPKVLQSNFRVNITGGTPPITGTWGTFEGGRLTRERTNTYDGGASYDIMVGKATYEDITLTRPYDPDKDDAWVTQLQRNINNGDPTSYNISKQATGPYNAPVGKPVTYPNCKVVAVNPPSTADGSEATAATIEIVFATKGPAN